ncbi:phosphatase PAP2 family protein [Nocardia sp. NPDC003482]
MTDESATTLREIPPMTRVATAMRRIRVWWALLVVCAAALIVSVVGHTGATVVDEPVLNWVVAHRCSGVTTAAKAVSDVGGTSAMLTLAVLAGALLVWRRQWAAAVTVAVATAGAGALVVSTKHLIGRARPPVADHLVVETNPAFPSGHSLGSIVVVGVVTGIGLCWVRRRAVRVAVITVAVTFVVAVGLSRLYLGVHWPTDIAGGWALGGVWLSACLAVFRDTTRQESG